MASWAQMSPQGRAGFAGATPGEDVATDPHADRLREIVLNAGELMRVNCAARGTAVGLWLALSARAQPQ